jgi:DNA-directed RNA polymerase specialized sigma24 family protein
MQGLPALDRQLLLGFHEGFCCAELASRFGRSEDCVKTRISRARRRVRTVFEDLVRVSGNLEESELEKK